MERLKFKDWKHGEVNAWRLVDGFYFHYRDLMRVLGVESPATARMGLKSGKERLLPYVDSLGRYREAVFVDYDRAMEQLGRYKTSRHTRVRAWVIKSYRVAMNGRAVNGVVEVRKRALSSGDKFALSQKSCLEAYIEDMGYYKGGKLDGAVLVRSSDLMEDVNSWKASIGGWENVKITQASLSRDMALLGYQSKMVRGCLWYWVVGV